MVHDEAVWILGGGQFGLHAAKQLHRVNPTVHIVIVEQQPKDHFPSYVKIVQAEAVEWLYSALTPECDVDKIVPALPIHLAAEWLKYSLTKMGMKSSSFYLSDQFIANLPNPYRITDSEVAVSHADFLCPVDCDESGKCCTFTRLAREEDLYQLLGKIVCGDEQPVIIRSRQFAAGVGGFFSTDLFHMRDKIVTCRQKKILLGTACRCHGIVSGIHIH